MSKRQLQQLSEYIERLGIEATLDLIDIESIDDLSIRIILRTLQTSRDNLLTELSEALS